MTKLILANISAVYFRIYCKREDLTAHNYNCTYFMWLGLKILHCKVITWVVFEKCVPK